MVNRPRIRPIKVAKKIAAKRVAAKATNHKTATKSQPRKIVKPILLAGDKPQIAKVEGDAPVQAYIAATPGWKRDIAASTPSSCAPSPARIKR